MITLKEGLELAANNVTKEKHHEHWEHVKELTDKYYRPFFGDNKKKLGELLVQVTRRETDADKTFRIAITEFITSAICEQFSTSVDKATKTPPVIMKVELADKDNETDTKKLTDAGKEYCGQMGVMEYLTTVVSHEALIDPNAFVVTVFDNFDARYDKPRSYPVMVSSEEAYNFEYYNHQLGWLLMRVPFEKKIDDRLISDFIYTQYQDDYHFRFTPVHPDSVTVDESGFGTYVDENNEKIDIEAFKPSEKDVTTIFMKATEGRAYQVDIAYQNSDVQAYRIGYAPDKSTKGKTMVSMMHPAKPYLMKSLKTVSELDITAAYHAFPQKIMYVTPCTGHGKKKCQNGKEMGTENNCKSCGGTGDKMVSSAMDHIVKRIPKGNEKDVGLDNMVVYKAPPTDILKWQTDYIKSLREDCYKAVFSSDIFTREEVAATATAKLADMNNEYQAHQQGLKHLSWMFRKTYRLLAQLNSVHVENINVELAYPSQKMFSGLSDNIELLKESNAAGASLSIVRQIESNAIESMFADDPQGKERALEEQYQNPFSGRSKETIDTIIGTESAAKEDRILFSNLPKILDICEWETERDLAEDDERSTFYDLSRLERNEKVKEVLERFISKIDEEYGDNDGGLPGNPEGSTKGGQEVKVQGTHNEQVAQLYSQFEQGNIDEASFVKQATQITGLDPQEITNIISNG